jgi:phytoene dehydrogenase-like protein
MQSLTDGLVRRAEREGATIRCGTAVEHVLVGGGRVTGVRLAGGEEVPADAVVSRDRGPARAPSPHGSAARSLHRRLRIWRYGTAPFKVDYALSGPVPWTAPEARASAVVHVAGELEELTIGWTQWTPPRRE